MKSAKLKTEKNMLVEMSYDNHKYYAHDLFVEILLSLAGIGIGIVLLVVNLCCKIDCCNVWTFYIIFNDILSILFMILVEKNMIY